MRLSEKKVWIIRILIFILAVIFIVTGLLRQEQLTVLQKAANICLQCIGIG